MRELLTDSRVSTDGRVLGLYIASKGEGEHEVPMEELQDVLSPDAGPARARRALGQLKRFGWVARRPGGKGHSDVFRFLGEANLKDSVAHRANLNSDSTPQRANLNGTVVDEIEREDVPPVVPQELDPEAEAEITEELTGCRGSLRDYLKRRVSRDKQYAFVQTVKAFQNGRTKFSDPEGRTIYGDELIRIVSLALNDLAASDEKPMRGNQGEPRNLANKIRGLIRDEYYGNRGGRRDAGADRGQSGGQASGDRGTETHYSRTAVDSSGNAGRDSGDARLSA